MSIEDLLTELRKDYLLALPQKILQIRQQIESSEGDSLRDSFHKLKGTGRTYGLPEVSELAELVEDICLKAPALAPRAAGMALSILADIHSARSHALDFDLQGDPRFQQLLKCQLEEAAPKSS